MPESKAAREGLYITYLENVNGKSWRLAPPTNLKPKIEASNNGKPLANISLVEWLTLNTELAVADTRGNFFLLLTGVGLLNSQKTPPAPTNGANGTGSNGTSTNANGTAAASNGNGTGNSNGVANGDLRRSNGEAVANGVTAAGSTNAGGSDSKLNLSQPSYEYTTFSHMELIYRDLEVCDKVQAPSDSTSQVFVAFKWLQTEKTHLTNKPATVNQSENGKLTYSYGAHQYTPKGVAHPLPTKHACVALRRNGEFVLYYQGEHKVEYHKISIRLEEEGSCAFEKAAIGFANRQNLVITAYDLQSNRINSYLVNVDWGFLVGAADKQKHDPLYSTPVANRTPPSLKKTKIDSFLRIPSIQITDDNDEITNTLTSIDLLAPSYDSNSKLEILMTYEIQNGNDVNSVIYRYRLQDQCDRISSSFLDLGMRKGITKAEDAKTEDYGLVLQDVWKRKGKVRRIEPYALDAFFLVISSDGRVDIIERDGMKLVKQQDASPKSILILQQAGFQFPTIDTSDNSDIMIGVSPTGLSIVYAKLGKKSGHDLELALMEKTKYLSCTDTDFAITAAAFATSHSYCCYTSTTTEDLIILIQNETLRIRNASETTDKAKAYERSQDFINSVLKASHLAINFYVTNYHKESLERLVQNPALQRLLSLQMLLGEMDDKNILVKDIAWSILNLRSTRNGIIFVLSDIYKQMTKRRPSEDTLEYSTYRGEIIMSLVGSAKFLVDFFIYMNQELVHLSLQKNNRTKSELTMENSIALPMIVSKVPRLILIYALTSVVKACEHFKKIHMELVESNKLFSPMKEALNRFFTVCSFSPINLALIEQFLRECDVLVSKEFSVQDQLNAEQELICRGKLSPEAQNVAKAILDRFSTYINRDTRVSEQFFYDVNWLGIGVGNEEFYMDSLTIPTSSALIVSSQANPTSVYRLQHTPTQCFDTVRKVDIDLSSSKIRKCSRCRGISLVADPTVYTNSTPIGLWTVHFQRYCICGGIWVHLTDHV